MRLAFQQTRLFHPFKERGHRVRITAHQLGQFALGNPLMLQQRPDQFTVMRTLLEHEGITQRKLTELMSSDPNTVASLLERMEKASLLERQTHERDRRANCLRLKPLAKSKYETARGLAVALQSEILSTLPEESREGFLENLDAVAQACRLAAEKSPKQKIPLL